MNHWYTMDNIRQAIAQEDAEALAMALAPVLAEQWEDENIFAACVALVNMDACTLSICQHPSLYPTSDGKTTRRVWMTQYLALRLSLEKGCLSKFQDGHIDALSLRRKITEMVRNLIFELPVED